MRFFRHYKNNRGFTIIEIIVVIAIIAVLSGIVIANINLYRMRARDVRKIADLKNIQAALQLFYAEKGHMPGNYTFHAMTGACEGGGEGDADATAYNKSMQELVDAGLLGNIPRSPGGGVYCYFDYGSTKEEFWADLSTVGALLKTTLEAAPDTTTGIPPSCRPWSNTDHHNWCFQEDSKDYCLCTPY